MVVENGSDQATLAVLQRLEKNYPKLRILGFPKPLGYGGAIREGLAHATKEWVFYTDGDGQYDPLEISKLVAKLAPGIDVVNGYKKRRSDSALRKVIGSLYNVFLHWVYPIPIRDVDCDFRLIRQTLLKNIDLSATSALAPLELVLKLQRSGARFAEVGISHYQRTAGRSEFFRLPQLVQTLVDHIRFARSYFAKR